jgi:acetylornithine/succinyldiaminopimelate/putrescine aminotransferase
MTLAKALAGGIPIGAILCKDRFAAFSPGDHGTTFGGNPLAAAAALVVVDELINNGVTANAAASGAYLVERLKSLNSPKIAEIRGRGLMVGVEFGEPVAKDLAKKLFDNGFLVGAIGEKIFRLVPPLIVTRAEIDLFIENLAGVL